MASGPPYPSGTGRHSTVWLASVQFMARNGYAGRVMATQGHSQAWKGSAVPGKAKVQHNVNKCVDALQDIP